MPKTDAQSGPLVVGPETIATAPESLSSAEIGAATSVLASALLDARKHLASARERGNDENAALWLEKAELLERAHAWLFRLYCEAQ